MVFEPTIALEFSFWKNIFVGNKKQLTMIQLKLKFSWHAFKLPRDHLVLCYILNGSEKTSNVITWNLQFEHMNNLFVQKEHKNVCIEKKFRCNLITQRDTTIRISFEFNLKVYFSCREHRMKNIPTVRSLRVCVSHFLCWEYTSGLFTIICRSICSTPRARRSYSHKSVSSLLWRLARRLMQHSEVFSYLLVAPLNIE